MKSALVTGATGFLGRALCARLIGRGIEVTALLRSSSDAALVPRGAGVVRAAADPAALARAVSASRPEAVFHLAGAAEGTPAELLEANFTLGALLARAAAESGVKTFVATGTYWQRREGASPNPSGLYAAYKQAQEDVLSWYGRGTGLRAATVSLYDVYGPADGRGKILSRLAEAARTGRPLDASPGRQRLELVYVDDAVDALIAAQRLLSSGKARAGSTWHAPSRRAVTLRAAAAALARVVGPVPVRWGARPYRPGETMKPWRGPAVPGWRPRVSLAEGLSLSFSRISYTEGARKSA